MIYPNVNFYRLLFAVMMMGSRFAMQKNTTVEKLTNFIPTKN